VVCLVHPRAGGVLAGSSRWVAAERGRDRRAAAETKRRFLSSATADRKGGGHSTGVRYFVTYCVHVAGVNPIQPSNATMEVKRLYETLLEDCVCWVAEHRPSGKFATSKTIGKYASQARAWYHRFYQGTLGLGAANSRISDILQGVAREVHQPPPRERHGVTPTELRRGMDARLGDGSDLSLMWRAALTFGVGALARGCEFALDDSRHEEFEVSEHITPRDVVFFTEGDVTHARVRMRKRKDLKVLRGKHAEVVLAGGGTCFDSALALRTWVGRRRAMGLSDDGPLFCTLSGVSITVSMVRDMVRAVMGAAGRPPHLYGAHSLRIGGATAALAAGVPPALIRLMGRWSSDVYEIYCRMSVQAALQVGKAVASATVSTFEGGFRHEHLELLPEEAALLPGASEETREEVDEDEMLD
jgi:hypothetical protein